LWLHPRRIVDDILMFYIDFRNFADVEVNLGRTVRTRQGGEFCGSSRKIWKFPPGCMDSCPHHLALQRVNVRKKRLGAPAWEYHN
jgi:hypothetical protein